jgi:hypothetical protein
VFDSVKLIGMDLRENSFALVKDVVVRTPYKLERIPPTATQAWNLEQVHHALSRLNASRRFARLPFITAKLCYMKEQAPSLPYRLYVLQS